MSYSESRLIPVETKKIGKAFAGGYIDNVEPLPNSYASYIRNGRLEDGCIKIRPGFELLNTFENVPIAIGKRQNTNQLIIRVDQVDPDYKFVLMDEDGTIHNLNATEQYYFTDNNVEFVDGGTSVYCCNGNQKLCRITGDDFYIVDSHGGATGGLRPSFGLLFGNSMWYGGDYNNPSYVYKSVADTYEDFTNAGKQTFIFKENITGLSSNNEILYIFTKNSISSIGIQDVTQDGSGFLFYNTRPVNAKEGSINHKSIMAIGVNTYFLTPSNKIQIISRGVNNNGFEIKELSHRLYAGVDKFMETLDKDQSDSFGVYLEKESLIKWHLKRDGSVFNDVILIYDIIHDKFLIDEYKYFNGSIILNGQQYSISAIEPKIFLDEYGNNDDDGAIDFEYHTGEYYFKDKYRKKILWDSYLTGQINNVGVLTQEIWLNDILEDIKTYYGSNSVNSTGGLGTFEIGTEPVGEEGTSLPDMKDFFIYRTKGNLNKKFKKLKYIFKFNTLFGKIKLIDLQHRIEMTSDGQTDLTL